MTAFVITTSVGKVIQSLNTTLTNNELQPDIHQKIVQIRDKLIPHQELTTWSTYSKDKQLSNNLTLADYKICLIGSPSTVALIDETLELEPKINLLNAHFPFRERIVTTDEEILETVPLLTVELVTRPAFALFSFSWFALVPDDVILDVQIKDLGDNDAEAPTLAARIKHIQQNNSALFEERTNRPYSLPSFLFRSRNVTIAQLCGLSPEEIKVLSKYKALPKILECILSDDQIEALTIHS